MSNKNNENNKPLLSDDVVLREVYDELLATKNKAVKVICQLNQKCKKEDVYEILKKAGVDKNEINEKKDTDYYVFVTLTEKQAYKIDEFKKKESKKKEFPIDHIWLNKKMKSCVVEGSQKTINVEAARMLFNSNGEKVAWAVLDTGIEKNHKWFEECFEGESSSYNDNGNDEAQRIDFTDEGFKKINSHGTHVAGIIAKIAPKIKLYDYKVLDKDGHGNADMIIRAMEHIRKLNFKKKADEMVIHGVNLSLGGPVPVGSYGCGWSPECQEANRLMASGVVVCVAAGNEGHQTLAAIPENKLKIFKTFVDVCISDPGNAEEVITVGSTHKTNPHSYGPSYFSSKGPTGDGRCKPDCLAPGERIESADANNTIGTIEMSGTSMATPHVSGMIAVFLSAKPEFKGQAQKVKQILLNSCTDLKRDRYFQGAGLVDALRMIQSV